MGQITVFSGPERRRQWTADQRCQILAEAFAPGACVAEVARRHDVSTGLLYTWRAKHVAAAALAPAPARAGSDFAQAVLVGQAHASGTAPAIIIDLPRGRRVTVFASAPPALVTAVLKAVR